MGYAARKVMESVLRAGGDERNVTRDIMVLGEQG